MFELVNPQVRQPKVFSIQVSGIMCTNCAGYIKKQLNERLSEKNSKVTVNVMQEKISLTVFLEQSIQEAVGILKDIGYPPIKEPLMLSGGEENHRTISFVVEINQKTKELEITLPLLLGVSKTKFTNEDAQIKIAVIYNCEIVKGRQIADFIEKTDQNFKVINERIQSFSKNKKGSNQKINVAKTIALCAFFLIANMILPFTGEWYEKVMTFPGTFGICTVSVVVNLLLTLYVMDTYALGFIRRAYNNYANYGATNMETLIALGSLSACALFLFFLVRYSIESIRGELMHLNMAVMDINDALTSASIIVLVVTIGKHFEGKVKEKIDRMTEEIFPESTLFKEMKVQYVEIKNRQLKIDHEKIYDISLIEKNDIIKVMPGRVLADMIIISGELRATQSANTGCEDIITLKKGERLESGSVVHEVEDALALVQNVLEKSILIEIGTQIKLAQNQEENEETGIQAVCKKISGIFVKGVILLSIFTMLVWSVLLYFNLVEVPMCDICWIVERGIGILVASCPCALGLAVPSVIAIVLNLATKSGILIKNNRVFEKMKVAKKIAFDKTGTLFTRIGKIEEYIVFSNNFQEKKIWEMVALIEKQIRHPLAEILYKEAFSKSEVVGTNYGYLLLQKPKIQKQGLSTEILDKTKNTKLQILIGNKHILEVNNIAVPAYEKQSQASTELFVSANNEVLMALLINTHSNLRPEAKDVVAQIQKEGLEVHILSGDSSESVRKIGDYLEVAEHCLHPEHSAFMKMKWIKENQEEGKRLVMMIGDGLNDIPCLQEAGIGISINAKSELNINAADVVILSENLYKILALVKFLNKGNLFIKINLFWAFAYNIIMMPIVAGAFYHFGVEVSPIWSSIAMSGSSLIVVGFSHLLSCFHYDDSLVDEKKAGIKMADTAATDRSDGAEDLTQKPVKNYAQLHEEVVFNDDIL